MAVPTESALSDTDLKRFIVSGFIELPPSPRVPTAAHAEVAQQILECGMQGAGRRTPYGLDMLDGDAAGNNLLHAAPALQGEILLESPALVGTLTKLLGPSYRIHPHCRAHLRKRGAHTTMWHVDAYKGTSWSSGRHHEPHWVMVCYYPQDTTRRMGPTELLPGSQYYRGDSDREHYSRGHIPDFSHQMDEWASVPHAVDCAAGTIVVMHYELWHRALESNSDENRLMLKFVAWRTAPPVRSSDGLPPVWSLVNLSCDYVGTAPHDPDKLLDFLGHGTVAAELVGEGGARGDIVVGADVRGCEVRGDSAQSDALPEDVALCGVASGDAETSGRQVDHAAGALPTEVRSLLTQSLCSVRDAGSAWAGLQIMRAKDRVKATSILYEIAMNEAKR